MGVLQGYQRFVRRRRDAGRSRSRSGSACWRLLAVAGSASAARLLPTVIAASSRLQRSRFASSASRCARRSTGTSRARIVPPLPVARPRRPHRHRGAHDRRSARRQGALRAGRRRRVRRSVGLRAHRVLPPRHDPRRSLFPRTAARQARGEDTTDILGRSLLVTAAFGGAPDALLRDDRSRAHAHELRRRVRRRRRPPRPVHDVDDPLFARERPRRIPPLARRDALRLDRRRRRPGAARRPRSRSLERRRRHPREPRRSARRCSPRTSSSSTRRVLALAAGMRHFATEATRRRFRGLAREVLVAPRRLRGPRRACCSGRSSTISARRSSATARMRRGWWPRSGGCSTRAATTSSARPTTCSRAHRSGGTKATASTCSWLLPYYPAYLATKVVGPVAAYNLVLLAGLRALGRLDVPARPLPRLRSARGRVGGRRRTSSSRGTWHERRTHPSSTSSSSRCSSSPSSPQLDDLPG